HRLSDVPVTGRHVRVARRKAARRALPVDGDPPRGALDLVLLELADVVRDVVDLEHPELAGAGAEDARERFPGPVGHRLPVGPGEVGRGGPRADGPAAVGRREGSAGALATRELEAG